MDSPFIRAGAMCALFGVAIGAFGAHGLKSVLSPDAMAIYQTGVNYHLWHAIALFALGIWHSNHLENKRIRLAGYLMLTGILLFSGSLYLLAISGYRWLGMITPIGGGCFLTAWLLLCLNKNSDNPINPTRRHS